VDAVVKGMDQRKAVVLLSGGMDSCVSAAMACEHHGASNIALLHASYGQRTQERERRAFDEIANFYCVREQLSCNSIIFARLAVLRSRTRTLPFRKMNWVRPVRTAVRFP